MLNMIYFNKVNGFNFYYIHSDTHKLWSDLPEIHDNNILVPGTPITIKAALKLFKDHPNIYKFLNKTLDK